MVDRPPIACDEALAQLAQFDAILDVRSPGEFAEDHVPGALNVPVLDDAERAEVGTLHKQVSAFAARRRGAVLAARNIARHVEALFSDKSREWRPLVYCWRGGARSGAMTHVLTRIGWHARQLEGGYRAYRRAVVAALQDLPARFEFRVICGTTGSGKSRLLGELRRAGAQVLDLERLAQHRGSVLGGLPAQPQPTQKMFETRIWWTLRSFDPARPVFVESESRKVGDLRVPDALIERMRAAHCVRVELPLPERVRLLRDEYLHFEADPQALFAQLDCLVPLHGRERIESWKSLARQGQWDALVERLLVEHYDPAYQRSIRRNFGRIDVAPTVRPASASEAAYAELARSLAAHGLDATVE
ncbi:tRNA 2-selenouridine(34) synthase MnmH [Betaproteobacteria bacterium PRO7]|jgi:tRNA 2-selenouridine synthase|nr:tRNA 2-selenouridine(34) synthase MnmH [Betaproteobacteria bacterium PRO7]